MEKEFIFYHGTSLENWNKIKKEGVLYGKRYVLNNDGTIHHEVDRCTYLATDKKEAEQYGDVILEVHYNPYKDKDNNNYTPNCWQIRVYSPILLSDVKRIK